MLLALTETAKTVLLVVAIGFIVYALVVSMVIPRRSPGFPGSNLGAFIAVTALFFLVQMGTVWWATSQEEEEAGRGEAVATETQPSETAETETAPTETETAPAETETGPAQTTQGTETTGAQGEGDPAAGEAIFASAGCGGCHTLAAAGSSGAVGPNLDDSSPSSDKVVERVTNGKGAMPSFADRLSEQEIRDVAAYVAQSARS